jgi:hypothetical protein
MKNFHNNWRDYLLSESAEEPEEPEKETKKQEKEDKGALVKKVFDKSKLKVPKEIEKLVANEDVDISELILQLKGIWDKLAKVFEPIAITTTVGAALGLSTEKEVTTDQKADLNLSYKQMREKFKGYKGEPTGFTGYIHFLWDEFDKNKKDALIQSWTKKQTESLVKQLAPKYGLEPYIPMGVMSGESGHNPVGIYGQTRGRKGNPAEAIKVNSTAYGMGAVTQTTYESIKHKVGVPHYMIWNPRYGIEAAIATIANNIKFHKGDLAKAMRLYAGTEAGGHRKMAAIAKAKSEYGLAESVEPEKPEEKEEEKIQQDQKAKDSLVKKFEKAAKTKVDPKIKKLAADEDVNIGELISQLKGIWDKLAKVFEPIADPIVAAATGAAAATGVATAALPSSEDIRKRNKNYFGNTEGKDGNGWVSSAKYSKRGFLNAKLGAIPFKGSPAKPIAVHPQWKEDNLVSANIGTSNGAIVHKSVLKSLRTAIEESQTVYGLPLRNNGAYVAKGTEKGLSAHAWGVAIDFEISSANPYNRDGMLDKGDVRIMLKKENYHKFTNSKNSYRAEMGIGKIQTYGEYLQSADATGKRAWPLYAFVAGPMVGRGQTPKNGISTIFKKHGWDWGGDWGGKKDGMHFSISGAG